MAKKDYYDILGVARDADDASLKKAFRRLAMKYHPDRNPDDKQAEEKFKEAKEAYDVLSDPQKRQAYNQFGHAGVQQGGGGQGFTGGESPFGDIFEDIFGDIFGGARRQGGRRGAAAERGADLRYSMDLSLEDAVFGKQVSIQVPTYIGCDECNGNGAKKGSSPVNCTTCNGIGQVRMQQGFFTVQQTCPACHGGGKVIKDPCAKCMGQGRVKQTKTLSVKIPPGVDTGDRVRLAHEGEAGTHGGPAGDLYVQISVKEHELFKREGEDLFCEVPINLVIASLGGEIEVPTLNGKVKLKIPAETQAGKIFRLRGQGVPRVRSSGTGDLLCAVVVETPINPNSEQKDLLKKLGESLTKDNYSHSPNAATWLNKVKRFIDNIAKR